MMSRVNAARCLSAQALSSTRSSSSSSMSSSKTSSRLLLLLLRARRSSWPSTLRRSLSSKRTSSRRKMLLAAVFTAGGILTTGALALPDAVGPIYGFEETDGRRRKRLGVDDDDEDQLPVRYDAQRIKCYWDRRPVEVFARSTEVTAKFVPFFTKLMWEVAIRRKILDHEGLQKKYAIELTRILTELGPCFVKLGQALSIRPDLLPNVVLLELQKLCDSVPSFPTMDALDVIEEELGCKADLVFRDISPSTKPVAAASLGQVYKLRLRTTGEEVAVKVQRPDMLRYVLRDLYIIRNLAWCLEKAKGLVTKQRPFDVALVDTFANASLQELDYLNEAANQERFRTELMPKLGGKVYIPKVFHELTTRKLLVTEWIEGVKLASSPKDVINTLTPVGVECFLVQLLETGFFHADPHPGNLLVTNDKRLALIDFGLCAEVPLPDTKILTMAIVHLMQGDVAGLIEDAVQLNFLPEDVDRERLLPDLQRIYNGAQVVPESKLRRSSGEYSAIGRRRRRFMAVSYDLNKVFFMYPFRVPDYFALMTRAMVVLEGIAVTGNPHFDLFTSAYPYATRKAVSLLGVANLSQIAIASLTAGSAK